MAKKKSLVVDLMESEEYLAIKESLMDELKKRGLMVPHYVDKVNEYMMLWIHLRLAADNVDARGVYTRYSNGATQKGTTENKSLSAEIRISAQMLSIWKALGFDKTAAVAAAAVPPTSGGEDDEL